MKDVRLKTLDELDPPAWGEPDGDSTSLVSTCHRLRRKPIGEFTVEDLRIMLGQGIGVRYLLPSALDLLEQNPLAEGDFYPGDLLSAVLLLDKSTWVGSSDGYRRVTRLIPRLDTLSEELREPVKVFRNRDPSQE